MAKLHPINDTDLRNLVRLHALLQNPAFLEFYYEEFFSFGFVPVDPALAKKDVRAYQRAIAKVLAEHGKAPEEPEKEDTSAFVLEEDSDPD